MNILTGSMGKPVSKEMSLLFRPSETRERSNPPPVPTTYSTRHLLYYPPPIDCEMARKTAKKTQAAGINETPAFPTHKKKSQSATSSLKTLQKVRNEKVNEFSMVKNTNNAYNGHVARGVGFLKAVVKERRENGEGMTCSLGIPTDELEKAFNKPPNRYSAMALEVFLVQKCFTDGLGTSTADGIHGAFAAYWDTM